MDYSILIPVYRSEKVLRETVLSALVQQGTVSYEIVLVEDGSPDESGTVCDALAAEYPETVRVIHRPHEGTVLTRRAAVKEAKGDFIVWLDSDDLLLENALETLSRTRETFPQAEVIIYELSFFYEDGRPEEFRPPLTKAPRLLSGEQKKELYELLVRGNRLDSLCIKAIRRELMQEDPSDYAPCAANPYGEDVLHSLYPLTEAGAVLLIPDVLYRYRMRAESVMHRFDEAQLDKRLNTVKWQFFAPFLQKWGLDDAAHQACLEAASYKGVLDGVLYFYEGDYDRKQVMAYAKSFAASHPRLKALAKDPAVGRKQQLLFTLFAGGHIRLTAAGYRLLKRLRGIKKK